MHVFDQGLLQAISSVHYSSHRPADTASLASAVNASLGVNTEYVVVFVRTRPEVAMTRLRQRPGIQGRLERIDSWVELSDAIMCFAAAVADVKQLTAILEKRPNHKFTIISLSNGIDISPDFLADDLYGQLVELGYLPDGSPMAAAD